MEKEKIIKAGKIASEVRSWIRPQIKKGMPLLEIAKKIESKIIELGGRPAFPVNLGVNEVAAHYTPDHNDETLAHGLLKVDFGVHIEGWAADQAFTLDLENNEENKRLIKAAEKSLREALKIFKEGTRLKEIGSVIDKTISNEGFIPVVNLSGHSMEEYELHAGITVPNVNNGNAQKIQNGLYAIEPFATNGNGKVKEGNPSGIYQLENERNIRNPLARKVLKFISNEYGTLPFCSRWIVKEFGVRATLALKELERNGNLHHFDQLVEISNGKVAQAEHTIFLAENGEKIVTTK